MVQLTLSICGYRILGFNQPWIQGWLYLQMLNHWYGGPTVFASSVFLPLCLFSLTLAAAGLYPAPTPHLQGLAHKFYLRVSGREPDLRQIIIIITFSMISQGKYDSKN